MPKARINDVELNYQDHDAAAGHPVVLFIHGGYGGPSTTLVGAQIPVIAEALQGVARTITYDRRCAGASEYVVEHFTLADVSADAVALLDHLEIERAIVVGSSAGGPVALRIALDAPNRVAALALPNTGTALMTTTPSGVVKPYSGAVRSRFERVRHFLDQVDAARSMGDKAFFESQLTRIRDAEFAPGSVRNRGIRKKLRRAYAACSDDELFRLYIGMLRNYEAYEGVDLTDELGRIDLPAWSVHGTEDKAVPLEYAHVLADGIEGLELHVIEGAGHGILGNTQAQALLRDWIERQGG